jgi:hypothetical protein
MYSLLHLISVAKLHFYDPYIHSVHDSEFDSKLVFLSDKINIWRITIACEVDSVKKAHRMYLSQRVNIFGISCKADTYILV